MIKDKWIYTFNLSDATGLLALWNVVKTCPQFSLWRKRSGLDAYFIKQPELMLNALIHTSFIHEQPQLNLISNERLEFLGDAFLDSEISLLLWENYPGLNEGELSKFRSSLVNEEVLAFWGRALGIEDFIMLGKGEAERSQVEQAIVADAFEALIGAMSLIDRNGIADILKLWVKSFDEKSALPYFSLKRLELFDPKTKLQEYTLELYKEVPSYESVEKSDIGFECSVQVKGCLLAKGLGKSKKKAEMAAAKKVLIEENYKNLI